MNAVTVKAGELKRGWGHKISDSQGLYKDLPFSLVELEANLCKGKLSAWWRRSRL